MNIVILAAGMGKRMSSRLPKVLHLLAGRPLLSHVLEKARALEPSRLVVVYGHGGQRVRMALDAPDLGWVLQDPPQGTGHAVLQALPLLDPEYPTLVLYGDVPLTRLETLRALKSRQGMAPDSSLALLTMALKNPTGYGRILRQADGTVKGIVEEKDASPQERMITEVNTGLLIAPTRALARWLAQLKPHNAQAEYYLTDIIAAAAQEGCAIDTLGVSAAWEAEGVNSRAQLAQLERIVQHQIAEELMAAGVSLRDPARLDVRGTLCCAQDVDIDVGCLFEGRVDIGEGASIGAYCVIRNASIAAGARIEALSHIDGAHIGAAAVVGPYARLRPGTVLGESSHIGNFVEVKNSRIDTGSKANHLAYIGDADIGQRVNVGAGVITCNYDGAHKHRTVIEDDVFVGSDTQLVAPVTIGRGATIGAGTTLTRDAPGEALTVSRTPQKSLSGWTRPSKRSNKE
jgi:bifunctional UDP-N-acetylglucosamine pyrophosphorylase/glucosamine-1-phosphate N-acetyltransferase